MVLLISVFGGLVFLSSLGGTLAFWSKLMQGLVLLKLYYPVDSLNLSHLRFLCQLTNQNNQGNKFHPQRAPYAPTWFQGRTSARISKSSSLGRRQKNQTCFFFQPQEKNKSLHANLLCNCVSYDIFVIYYVYKYDVYIYIYILVIGYLFY